MPADVRQAVKRLAQAGDVRRIAVMPDVHLSHDVCTGLVVATGSRIYPQAVGNDIGCGMAAIRFDASADVLDERNAAALLDGLARAVPAMRQPAPLEVLLGPLSDPALERIRARDGRVQLGTLGRGNHFVEFQEDDDGRLWLMLHSGSRAIGQAVTERHLARAERDASGLSWFDADSAAGAAYLRDMEWALAYAERSRATMIERIGELVRDRLGVALDEMSRITCNHNHVRREVHFGEPLWVHRKGTLSARDGEASVIPGSMGTLSFHVAGRGDEESMCSSSHGAGRRLSRTDARSAIRARDLERQMKAVWFDHRLANALREEAPAAYKDIRAVMRAQRNLTRIVRTLRPRLVYKGT